MTGLTRWAPYACTGCHHPFPGPPADVLALGPYGSNLPFCSETCSTTWMAGQWDGTPAPALDVDECEHPDFVHDRDVPCADALTDHSDRLSADVARSVWETQ